LLIVVKKNLRTRTQVIVVHDMHTHLRISIGGRHADSLKAPLHELCAGRCHRDELNDV
jgi:hypothetical protein